MNETHPAPRILKLLVGIVAAVIRIGLLYLVGSVLIASFTRPDGGPDKKIWILTSIMLVLGIFFPLVSFRLLFNRGAKGGGGLLSPAGWRVLGGMFSGLAILFAVSGLWRGQWNLLGATIAGAVFGQICFQLAKKYSQKLAGS